MKPGYSGRFNPKRTSSQALLRNPNFVKRKLLKPPKRQRRNVLYNNQHWSKIETMSAPSEEIEDSDGSSESLPPTKHKALNVSEDGSSSQGGDSADNSRIVTPMKPLTKDNDTNYLQKSSELESGEEESCTSESAEEEETVIKDNSKKFWLFESQRSDTAVLVLNHPCEVVLTGCLQVRALSGSAEIHGWHLSSDIIGHTEFLPVYSSKHYGRFILETREPERLPKRVKLYEHLEARLASVAAETFITNVISVASSSCVVVALTRLETSRPVSYATSILTPNVFSPHQGAYICKRLGFSLCQNKKGALSVKEDHRHIAEQVNHAIQYSRSINAPAPKILICGDVNTGKSTFMRFLINSVLSSEACTSIYHLDLDPGQSEFTPSSCVALTRVSSSLLGPPFTHQKTPVRQCFVGGPSVANTPGLYIQSMKKLLECYYEKYSSEPLFINTMGWTRGLGLTLLVDILRLSFPNLVIQMHNPSTSKLPVLSSRFLFEECGWSSIRELNPKAHDDLEFKTITAICDEEHPQPQSEQARIGLAPPQQRALSALTYLGSMLKNRSGGEVALTEVEPFCIPWQEVAVMLSSKAYLKQEDLVDIVNGSWVALCSIPDSQISHEGSPALMKFAKSCDNFCIGFGLVRGIDLEKELILLLTPEPLSRLQAVNAFCVMGDLLPKEVYLSQEVEGPLPYVCQTSVASKLGLGVKVKQIRKTYFT